MEKVRLKSSACAGKAGMRRRAAENAAGKARLRRCIMH
jgi:hypothetical protein